MPKPDYTALTFPPAPPDRPYVVINMVMSADGKTVLEGTEQGIGSKTDQRLMRELRVHPDVILNGASTLRVSGSSPRLGGDAGLEALRLERGKSRFATIATMSRSGNLPLDKPFFTAADFEAVVYLAAEAPPAASERLAATGRTVVTLPDHDPIPFMLTHMRRALGASLLLVEGGPTTNAQLFENGAVDDYFVTLGPVIVGGRDTLTAVEGKIAFLRSTAPRLELLAAFPNEETGEVYLHYRVQHEALSNNRSV